MNDVETGYQDYGFRMYSVTGRRFNSVDPLTKKYPMLTPYQFASNNPVWMLDLDGLEGFKFSDVWNNRATLFDFIQNPDVTGTVGEFNRSFNPLFILNNYGVKLRTGHDYDGNPIDSRGKAGVVADLGVEAMQWITIGKLFGSVPKATTAMEQEMTQVSKAMGKIEATPKQSAAMEVTKVNGEAGKVGATVGFSTSKNYRATFFAAHPGLEGKVVVHHAVEQQVLTRYPGLFTEGEINSLQNLRGIPNAANNDLHLSQIRRAWNQFYRTTASPTKEQVLNKATEIDKMFGSQFLPTK